MTAPFATILVPTHDHTPLIGYALRAIQEQTASSFELFVIGDGAPPATREIVEQIARSDERISYLEFEKGERHGEAHRHLAMSKARGDIVAYCGDDDFWLPGHLEAMTALLERVDFGHLVQLNLTANGRFVVRPGDLADPVCRSLLLTDQAPFFGLTVAGHRMSAYRQLKEGWTPAPPNIPTDQNMWKKFLSMPGLRFGTQIEPTSVHVVSPLRSGWTMEERSRELSELFGRRNSPGLRRQLEAAIRKAYPDWRPSRASLVERFAARIAHYFRVQF